MEFPRVLLIAGIVAVIIGILSIVASSIMLAKGRKDFMEKYVDVCEQADIPLTPEEQKIGARYRGQHPNVVGPLPGPKYAQETTYGAITCPGVFDSDSDDPLTISIRKATCKCRKIRKASCSLLLVSGVLLIIGGILTVVFTSLTTKMSKKTKMILFVVFLGLSFLFSIIAFSLGIANGIHVDPVELDYEIYNEETNPEGKFFVAWAMMSAIFDLAAIILIVVLYCRLALAKTGSTQQNKSPGSKTGNSRVSPAENDEKVPAEREKGDIDGESQGKASQASSSRSRQLSSRKSGRLGKTQSKTSSSARSGTSSTGKSKPKTNATSPKAK